MIHDLLLVIAGFVIGLLTGVGLLVSQFRGDQPGNGK